MKRYLLIALLVTGTAAFAQEQQNKKPVPNQKERMEKMESMKIAFIAQKLDLTPDEAQKFWPVYNEFTQKNKELRKSEFGDQKGKRKDIDSMTEKEADELMSKQIAFQEKHLDLVKEYNVKFKTVLPVKKVARLYQAEKQFNMQMAKKKQQRGDHNRKPQPPPLGK